MRTSAREQWVHCYSTDFDTVLTRFGLTLNAFGRCPTLLGSKGLELTSRHWQVVRLDAYVKNKRMLSMKS
jgi:hypothetical protein